MAPTFEYAVLTAIPDPRRGERVNVGLVVFRPDRADVRFKHASQKLRALTGEAWDDRMTSAEARLKTLFEEGSAPAAILAEFEMLEPLLQPSQLGWLSAPDEGAYEQRVAEIMSSLVGMPPRERAERHSRINTEIAAHFRQVHLLAKGSETIRDGKVVRDFPIAPNEGLSADFALRNGKMHIASTLDLRKQTSSLGEAALKSIVLDKSEKIYRGNLRSIGVYAVEPDMAQNFKEHIELLNDYSHVTYNWSDPNGQWGFKKSIYDAARLIYPPRFGGTTLD